MSKSKNQIETQLNKFLTPTIKIILFISLIIGIAIGFGINYLLPKPVYQFSLNGDNVITLRSASQYQEQGVKVIVDGQDLSSDNIKIIGTVEDQIGVYVITYQVENIKGLENLTLTRIVIIVGDEITDEPTETDNLTETDQGGNN